MRIPAGRDRRAGDVRPPGNLKVVERPHGARETPAPAHSYVAEAERVPAGYRRDRSKLEPVVGPVEGEIRTAGVSSTRTSPNFHCASAVRKAWLILLMDHRHEVCRRLRRRHSGPNPSYRLSATSDSPSLFLKNSKKMTVRS